MGHIDSRNRIKQITIAMIYKFMYKRDVGNRDFSFRRKAAHMKKIVMITLYLFLFYAVAPAMAAAQDFAIDDPLLSALPKDVEKALSVSKKDPEIKTCEFIGEPIDLDGNGKATDFFVTTADGCACVRTLCPIWIIRGSGQSYAIVLSYKGDGLSLLKPKGKGLANIVIVAATEEWEESTRWVFDGHTYKKGKKTFKDLSGH